MFLRNLNRFETVFHLFFPHCALFSHFCHFAHFFQKFTLEFIMEQCVSVFRRSQMLELRWGWTWFFVVTSLDSVSMVCFNFIISWIWNDKIFWGEFLQKIFKISVKCFTFLSLRFFTCYWIWTIVKFSMQLSRVQILQELKKKFYVKSILLKF